CLWLLWRCRSLPRGWLCAMLAFLGLANGLAPWTVRNFQAFGDLVPVSDSVWLHVWIGVNGEATGGPQDEAALRRSVAPEGREKLLAEKNQARRYAMLAHDVAAQLENDPAGAARRRLLAAQCFLVGEDWGTRGELSRRDASVVLPDEVGDWYALTLQASLLA